MGTVHLLAGRINPCSHGMNQISHSGKVVAALIYLTQVFIAIKHTLLTVMSSETTARGDKAGGDCGHGRYSLLGSC